MDKIKAKIQSLCPDVMELKFGCEVRTKGNTSQNKKVFVIGLFAEDIYSLAWIDNTGVFRFFGKAHELNVLGSPITLAVVLRAIQNSGAEPHAVDDAGFFLEFQIEGWNAVSGKVSPRWNLEHDTYDAQSQETKDFIGKLLNV